MNDNDIISYLKRSAKVVSLSFAEKENIRNHIISSPFVLISHFWTSKKLVAVLAVLVAVLTGGGASFAAASSLPGEALYSVKINVNEEVQSFIAISPDAKAKVEVERVKERLNEAEKLSAKGKLTDETQTIIKNNIKKHTQNIKEKVVILASEKKAVEANQIIDDMKISLGEHETALENLSSSNVSASSSVENDQHIGAIISSVIEAKAEMQNVKDAIEISSATSSENNASSTPQSSATSTEVTVKIDIGVDSTSTPASSTDLIDSQKIIPNTNSAL